MSGRGGVGRGPVTGSAIQCITPGDAWRSRRAADVVKLLALAPLALLAGCATVSQMAATGGSRSDGIVRLSFEAGMFDKVAIDEVGKTYPAKVQALLDENLETATVLPAC